MKQSSNKKVTTQDLATMVSAGFAHVHRGLNTLQKNTAATIVVAVKESQEELARMVAAGFEQSKQDLENVHKELKLDIQRLDMNVERIDMRLDNLAPQFEVDDLKRRVTKLEKTAV